MNFPGTALLIELYVHITCKSPLILICISMSQKRFYDYPMYLTLRFQQHGHPVSYSSAISVLIDRGLKQWPKDGADVEEDLTDGMARSSDEKTKNTGPAATLPNRRHYLMNSSPRHQHSLQQTATRPVDLTHQTTASGYDWCE